jgi:hypothetical protein
MPSWLKAGLIGAAILIVLNLLGLIKFVSCLVIPLRWITYIVVGVLAASYMLPGREAGKAAGQGALAAVLASFLGGLVNFIISLIRGATTNVDQVAQALDQLNQISPEFARQVQDFGVGPEFFAGVGSVAICGTICCFGGILLAAALGAIGAAIYASAKPE